MKLFKHSIKTKGLKNFLKRFFTIATRFGITPVKYINYLKRFEEIQKEFSFKTSFPITAEVMLAHGKSVKPFQDKFLFLLHGLYHIDHTFLESHVVPAHISRASEIFQTFGINEHLGFRAPYLRYNEHIRDVLVLNNFLFDSSRTIFVNDQKLQISQHDMEIINDLYRPEPFHETLSLPYSDGNLIELPVTLPDDEITIDRLSIQNKDDLLELFSSLSDKIFSHQEMFIMQVHPERIPFLFNTLKLLLKDMVKNRNIWITDLCSLAKWHKNISEASYIINENKSYE